MTHTKRFTRQRAVLDNGREQLRFFHRRQKEADSGVLRTQSADNVLAVYVVYLSAVFAQIIVKERLKLTYCEV